MVNVPNILTLFRILLIPAMLACFFYRRYDNALLLLAMGGITDYLDGYIARNFKSRTRLGSLLDPLADKLLVNAMFGAFAWLDILPLGLVALVFARDLVLAGGAGYLRFVKRRTFEIEPTYAGKTNTFLQLVLIVTVLISMIRPGWPLDKGIVGLVALVAIFTLISLAQYLRKGVRILKWPGEPTRPVN